MQVYPDSIEQWRYKPFRGEQRPQRFKRPLKEILKEEPALLLMEHQAGGRRNCSRVIWSKAICETQPITFIPKSFELICSSML